MFSAASKVGFSVTGGAVVAAVVYAFGTGDRNGFALLMFTGVVFLAFAIGAFYSVGSTELAVEAGEVEATPRPVQATLPSPSPWPLGLAAAVTLVVLAAAAGAWFFATGVVLLVGTGLLWFAQAWREHPSWTTAMTERLNQRIVVPFLLPALAIALLALGAVSFSRIFLAASRDVAPLIAIVAAAAILAAGFVIASAERMGRTAINVIAAVSGVLVIASGVVGVVVGEREFHHAGGEAAHLTVRNAAFVDSDIEIPAGTEVDVVLRNDDIGASHNFAVYTEPGGELVFRGEPVTGRRITTYTVKIDEPGEYHFQSDEHSERASGTLTVVEGGGDHGGGHGADDEAGDSRDAKTGADDAHDHSDDH